jgi:transposase
VGAYRPAHRTSDGRRELRTVLAMREALVRTRTAWISRIQPVLRREGYRIRSGNAETFVARVEELTGPEVLKAAIGPLLRLLPPLNEQIAVLDEQLAASAAADDVAGRLVTVPGVGPVTALAFVVTVDDVRRFRDAHHVESYVGLVPREWSSSETQRRGQITKAGNSRMRWLLVQAAWCICGDERSLTPQPSGTGLTGSPNGEAAAWRPWRWLVAWQGFFTLSGGTRRSIAPPSCKAQSRRRRRRSTLSPGPGGLDVSHDEVMKSGERESILG